MWRIHVAGEPMLPKNLRKLASSELQSVHDGVLTIERRLLSDKDPPHPVFMVKVPPGLGFVDNAPANLFFCGSTTSSICSTYTRCTIPWSICFLSAWTCRSLERTHRASL